MTKGGRDHFDEFADHTLLKHLVLDKYLKRWGPKLLSGKVSQELWFVDAFAGEGSDKKGNPGSPVIAARVAEDLTLRYPLTQRGHPPMRVLAIELDGNRGDRLQNAMGPFREHSPPLVEVRIGTTLHEILAGFLQYVEATPSLFFLDPFGVDGLMVSDLPGLLSGPHNEVFSLFSDTGAHRLYAALRSQDRDVRYEVQQVLNTPSLFSEMTEEDAARVQLAAERSNEGRQRTQEAARRIFQEAFGNGWEEELRDVPDEELPERALSLWMQRLMEAGAAYVLSLPVRDSRNAHVYQLVYASKSPHGLRAMKQSIQEALNASTLPGEVKQTIQQAFSVGADEGALVTELQKRFAGQRVRWRPAAGEQISIQNYLLDETPLLPGQFDGIKQALIGRGWKEPGRTIYFRFPDED